MRRSILLTASCIAICSVVEIFGEQQGTYGQLVKQDQFLNAKSTISKMVQSVIQCQLYCSLQDQQCWSFNFHKQGESNKKLYKCELFDFYERKDDMFSRFEGSSYYEIISLYEEPKKQTSSSTVLLPSPSVRLSESRLQTYSLEETHFKESEITVSTITTNESNALHKSQDSIKVLKPSIADSSTSSYATDKPITTPKMTQTPTDPITTKQTTIAKSTMKSCKEYLVAGSTQNGIYKVRFFGADKEVYCDMTTDGGGWIVIQKRFDGSVDFDRNWKNYQFGFGSVYGEYWIGNDFLNAYTAINGSELWLQASRSTNETKYVKFRNFKIDDENPSKFNIKEPLQYVSGFRTTNIDQAQFSASDGDFDNWEEGSCGKIYSSGWWFTGPGADHCFDINLNGIYVPSNATVVQGTGIIWKQWTSTNESLVSTKIMIR